MPTELGFDVDVKVPSRPTINDPEVRANAAMKLALKLAKWLKLDKDDIDPEDGEFQEVYKDALNLVEGPIPYDGYGLAKVLEHRGYDPDSELVEILDDVWLITRRAVDKATAEWVEEYAIKIPVQVGDYVKVRFGHGVYLKGRILEGTVSDLFPREARFSLKTEKSDDEKDLGKNYIHKIEDIVE